MGGGASSFGMRCFHNAKLASFLCGQWRRTLSLLARRRSLATGRSLGCKERFPLAPEIFFDPVFVHTPSSSG